MRNCIVLSLAAASLLGMPGSRGLGAEAQSGGDSTSQRSVRRMDFGKTPEGTPVDLYVLSNGGITVKVMT